MLFTPSPLRRNLTAALRDLNATRPEVRASAARDLGIAGEDDPHAASAALASLLDDQVASVRAAALMSMGMLHTQDHVSRIARCVRDDDAQVRQYAVVALHEIGGDDARAALDAALESASPDVRFQAMLALVADDPSRALDACLARLGEDDVWIASEAARAMGELLTPDPAGAPFDLEPMEASEADRARAREALRTRLAASSGRVAVRAAIALSRLGDDRGRAQMVALLSNSHELERSEDVPDLRLEAIERLGAIGGAEAQAILTRLAWRWAPSLERDVARAALARLGDARAVEKIREQLRSRWASQRIAAILLAAQARLVEAVSCVTEAVRNDGFDPHAAARAYAAIGGPEGLAALEAMLEEHELEESAVSLAKKLAIRVRAAMT
jgi:HEAT repeat protein